MSASLRSAVPAPTLRGARQSATCPDRSTPPMQCPAAYDRQTGLNLDGVDEPAEQEALAVSQGQASSPLFALDPRLAEHGHSGQRELDVPGKHNKQPTSERGTKQLSVRPPVLERDLAAHVRHSHPGPGSPCSPWGTKERAERPSRRPATLGRRPAAHDRQTGLNLDGVDGHAEQEALAVSPGRPRGVVLPGPRPRPEARPGSRFGYRRGVAGLVVVCVLALGAAACSVKDAKAEASVSASASASAAIARAEKGIADANASATASREAALTPELRAKRDAALAEPAPAKPSQMTEESPEGAASSVRYFLELYRYAFMTGNTTELAKMSEDSCKFCQSAISRATSLHATGGWIDKWEQNITNTTYYEKLEGRDYNRVTVVVDYGAMTSHPGDGRAAKTSTPDEGRNLNFGVRYVNGRWFVGGVEVAK